jgi:hypothetical protein
MKLPALVRTIIRGTTWFSTDGLADLVRREKLWLVLLGGGGILAGAAVVIFMLTGTYRGLLSIGIASGHPELPFFFAILASWAFLFVTALPLALSLISYSRDTRLLMVLPFSPGEIVGAKAALLYEAIDGSGGFYRGHAHPASRSRMNVTFRLPSEELEKAFLKEAQAQELDGLKGHRSVGGLRASIYNACPIESVRALAGFMGEFRARRG